MAANLKEGSYTFENIGKGRHTGGIKAIYASGESAIVNFQIFGVDNEKEANKAKLRVYPNPTSDGRIYVDLDQSCHISLYDFTGKKILSKQMQEGTNILDLSIYSKGIYIIHVEGKSIKGQQKIILK